MASASPLRVHVHPSGPLGGYLRVPPSKNYSTRLILAAAMAEGASVVRGVSRNDDARALVACCRALGAAIEEAGDVLTIRGVGGRPKNPGRLNPGNAGAVLRLLLGVGALVDGELEFVTDFADSLGKRPNEDLLAALRQLGAEVEGQGTDGRLPIRLCGGRERLTGTTVRVSGARSSQYLSALLYLMPHLNHPTILQVGEAGSDVPGPLVSRPLIPQTLDALARFGQTIEVDWDALQFTCVGSQPGRGGEVAVPGDWPSAAALMAAVAVGGGMATLYGLEDDAQGERRAQEALVEMGCRVDASQPGHRVVHCPGPLKAITFNGDLATDAVLALVGAACLAEGTSRFENIGNLRLKECDRIREPLEELAKLGVVARHGDDWIEIDGQPEGYTGGVCVDSRGDHRVAQLLALVGMRCAEGITIERAEHISKSYPDFFEDLMRLGVKLELERG